MLIIDINKNQGVDKLLFPDNQPHIKLNYSTGHFRDYGENCRNKVKIICALDNSLTVMHLLETANALEGTPYHLSEINIPYLMGARFDRRMEFGDSFDLKVIANLINSCKAKSVGLFDPHSDVAPALINNSHIVDNSFLVHQYTQKDAILICPDSGAAKKVSHYMTTNPNIKDIVYCVKHRDLGTGAITLKVLEPEKCTDRNCVIVDDLCDGGGTFLAIASQIKKANHLTLIVSHAIFSKGTKIFEGKFDEIMTTNSYPQSGELSKIVRVLPHPF